MSLAGDILRAAANEMPEDTVTARAWLTARAAEEDRKPVPVCIHHCEVITSVLFTKSPAALNSSRFVPPPAPPAVTLTSIPPGVRG